ncbi:MAG: BatA and WFA domain-containing protein [Bacteroidetes bacterium]|nr:BatA and WFA domain-containing protein [Bacteroidota bacterium]
MNFLNPAALFGLLAVSVPILIHLLNLRKIRKVDFSTLMFLKEIQKSKMRRIKLKQLLLLLIRICIIIFLVFTFAKPVYEGYSFNSDSGGKSTVLIFLDDSFSMDASDGNGPYFSRAKESVKQILKYYKESDEIILIPSSEIGYRKSIGITGAKKEITDSLNTLKTSLKPFKLDDALTKSEQIFRNSVNPNKDVFIVSDFQRNNAGNFNSKTDNSDLKDVNFFLIRTGERTVSNLSLDSFKMISKIPAQFGNIKVSAELTNYSDNNVTGKSIKLYLDDKLTEETSVDVKPKSSATIQFSFIAPASGDLHGYMELGRENFLEDELIQDNKLYFDIYIPGKINVGLIGGQDEFRFINAAINSAREIMQTDAEAKLFDVKMIPSISPDIMFQDVLMISLSEKYTENEISLLKEFLNSGKGIFIFPNEFTDISNFNSVVSSKLDLPKIDKLNADESLNRTLKFGKIDFENPLMSEIFRNSSLNINSDSFLDPPGIKKYFELILNERNVPVMMLSNERAFIAESELPKGKILISAVSPVTGFSDFPVNNIFPPVMIRSIFYLNSDFGFSGNYYTGSANIIPIKGLKNITDITGPEKNNFELKAELTGSGNDFFILPYSTDTKEKGLYILKDSAGNKFGFSLNNDPAESDPQRMDPEEIKNFFSASGISDVEIISRTENIADDINSRRNGTSLWKYFLIAAILLTGVEMFYSKKLED